MHYLKSIFFRCFPVIKWVRDYRILKKESDDLLYKRYELNRFDSGDTELLNKLNRLNQKEMKRKETLEDKGKSILLILTLTGTILLGTMRFLLESTSINWITIILFIGILYLIISIALNLSVINATMFSDLYLNDSYKIEKSISPLVNDEEMEKITIEQIDIESVDENTQIAELIRSIELNQITLLIKANDLSCALSSLKRSFIKIFIFLCFSFIDKTFPNFFINLWNFLINFFCICS